MNDSPQLRPRYVPPEAPGPLDFPLSPALGSTGPFVPAGAAMMGLTLIALACLPVLWPADWALVSMQALVLVMAWLLCDSRHESAERCFLMAGRGLPVLPPHVPFPLSGQVACALALGLAPAPGGVPEASLLVDGHDYPVKDLALLGRAADCHIPLDDPTLALYQAALVPSRGRLAIVNLQSAELTVNGIHTAEQALEPGDVVRLGRTVLVYYRDQVGAEPPRAAVATLQGPAGTLALARSSYYWIGRDPQRCQLTVDDPGAADRHALIAVGATGTVTLVDFTSPLGTRVNQRRSHFRVLADGDVLTLGQTALTFSERI